MRVTPLLYCSVEIPGSTCLFFLVLFTFSLISMMLYEDSQSSRNISVVGVLEIFPQTTDKCRWLIFGLKLIKLTFVVFLQEHFIAFCWVSSHDIPNGTSHISVLHPVHESHDDLGISRSPKATTWATDWDWRRCPWGPSRELQDHRDHLLAQLAS